ncbi:outer membrane protein [Sphingomonas solaris]|uniref:Porin family protein n=1 Tax=Alterirhizorhabdus solaris TaxID=2529389 RepID=A0A558R5C7_9SPHN|nr:outer membrane beta-barrel protein [Sphingomonas solaris]TVV74569.1 porin family protein [Sphingomonas solaris]
MKKIILALATAGAALGATAASAQVVNNTTFRGFRAEGQVGGDRFQSQGESNNKFGYGGAIGFDGTIGDKIVVGPEATYWRANEWNGNRTAGVRGGVVDHKSFEEWGAAVRVGYLVTPALLVYGKAGYVSNEFRKSFIPAAPTATVRETGYYNRGRSDGYQVGGGVEYSLTDMFYVNGEYKYSNYANDSVRQRALVGFGVRFKPGF